MLFPKSETLWNQTSNIPMPSPNSTSIFWGCIFDSSKNWFHHLGSCKFSKGKEVVKSQQKHNRQFELTHPLILPTRTPSNLTKPEHILTATKKKCKEKTTLLKVLPKPNNPIISSMNLATKPKKKHRGGKKNEKYRKPPRFLTSSSLPEWHEAPELRPGHFAERLLVQAQGA